MPPKRLFIRRTAVCWAAVASLLAAGCQSNRVRDVSNVRPGMDKSDVLDSLGNPDKTLRWKGKDRWFYLYRDGTSETVNEIQFEDGRVTYAGPQVSSKLSAAERDRLNEEANLREQARLEKAAAEEKESERKRRRKLQEWIAEEERAPPPAKAERWEPVR